MAQDLVGCICGSTFPSDYIDCGDSKAGDHLWRCKCGVLYAARGGDENDIWEVGDDDITDEESGRGLF